MISAAWAYLAKTGLAVLKKSSKIAERDPSVLQANSEEVPRTGYAETDKAIV
jgi:hypothetical protein